MIRRANAAARFAVVVALGLTPRPAAALDLAGALRQVVAASPTLAARRAMAEAAGHEVAPAGAWDHPMLETGVINVPVTGRFDTDPMTMKMVALTQRVPISGARGLAADAARSGAAAEGAAVEATRDELLGMGLEAYGDAWTGAELERTAEAHHAVMERLVQSARARYESGRGRLEDVLRAEAERARSRADAESWRAERSAARARLDALRGVTPGAAADTLAPPATAAVPEDPASWIAAADGARPRVRELDQRAGHYRYAARAARREAWPDLELKGAYGWRETLEGGIPQENMFSATVAVTLPIFAGRREGSTGDAMDALARASEAERDAARLDLAAQVAGTHAAALAAQRTVRLDADSVLTALSRAVEASWAAYGAGNTDLWRVFESSHALYGEEIALARARQDLLHAQARMLSLTGRADLVGVTLPAAEGGRR